MKTTCPPPEEHGGISANLKLFSFALMCHPTVGLQKILVTLNSPSVPGERRFRSDVSFIFNLCPVVDKDHLSYSAKMFQTREVITRLLLNQVRA